MNPIGVKLDHFEGKFLKANSLGTALNFSAGVGTEQGKIIFSKADFFSANNEKICLQQLTRYI